MATNKQNVPHLSQQSSLSSRRFSFFLNNSFSWFLEPMISGHNSISNDEKESSSSSTSSINVQLYLVNIVSCCIISFSSMFTLFIFLNFINHNKKNNSKSTHPTSHIFDPHKSELLKLILAFAVGSLVADVFLHILPEASVELQKAGYGQQHLQHFLGVWILVGVLLFATIETFFQLMMEVEDDKQEKKEIPIEFAKNHINENNVLRHRNQKNSSLIVNGETSKRNVHLNIHQSVQVVNRTTGYLNLLANGFDNFTHGMSVAASYLISYKMGMLTTLAIAVHEIPHEMVDFVILLRSGFSCWRAFRAQLSISLVTILGAVTVLYCDQYSRIDGTTNKTLSYTLWILPMTSGGFIYIALTSLLPELLDVQLDDDDEKNHRNGTMTNERSSTNKNKLKRRLQLETISKRLGFVIFGIIVMEAVNAIDL